MGSSDCPANEPVDLWVERRRWAEEQRAGIGQPDEQLEPASISFWGLATASALQPRPRTGHGP